MLRFLRNLILCTFLLSIFTSFCHAQVPTVSHNLQINATVPPKTSDIEFFLTASVPEGTELSEGDEVTFTISYRSLIDGSFPLTIEGFWEQGLIEGSGGSFIDVYDYVIGSATTADGGAVPIVDLMNRKITWNINSLASSATPHTVSFTLRVKSSLPTTNRIEVFTKARGEFGGTPIPTQDYQLYVKSQPVSPTPTLTPGPSATPTVTPNPLTPTPTQNPQATRTPTPIAPTSSGGSTNPTNTPAPGKPTATPTPLSTTPIFEFVSVDIEQISDDSVTISVETTLPSVLTIHYGICGQKLTEKLVSDSEDERQQIEFTNLTPDTQYCFQIIAKDAFSKKTITSDIFTFRTASDKEQFKIVRSLVTWNNIILSIGNNERLVAPVGKTIVISFEMEHPESIDEIRGSFESESVLGATTMTQPRIAEVLFLEMAPGMFSAEIATPQIKGFYTFTLKVKDVYGSFSKKQLPITFVLSEPLRVINSKTSLPIENAHITIEKMETSSQRYKNMQQSFVFPNAEDGIFLPYSTNQYGELDMILPPGKYKLEVSALGYESQMHEIYLGVDTLEYPTISLQPRFAPETYLEYAHNALKIAGVAVPFYLQKFFSTRTIWTACLVMQLLLFFFSIFCLSLKKKLYYHIRESGRVIGKGRIVFIQAIKIIIISTCMLSIAFIILFATYQSIIMSMPFIMITLLLLLFIFLTKTKPADL